MNQGLAQPAAPTKFVDQFLSKPSAPLSATEFYRGEINQDISALRITLSNLSSSGGVKLDKDLFFQAHAALNIAETLLAKAIQ